MHGTVQRMLHIPQEQPRKHFSLLHLQNDFVTNVGSADFNFIVGISLSLLISRPYSIGYGISGWERWADLVTKICIRALRTSSVGGRQRRSPLKYTYKCTRRPFCCTFKVFKVFCSIQYGKQFTRGSKTFMSEWSLTPHALRVIQELTNLSDSKHQFFCPCWRDN